MGEWLAGAWDDISGFADRHVRAFTIAISLIAVPAALLFLVPVTLQATADTLEPQVADSPGVPVSFTFLDADGKVIGRQGPVAGRRLRLSEMPLYLPAAFLAMEDRRFWRHQGVDFMGLSRAAYADLKARRAVAGGSTISQQTAKLLFTTRDRTIGRKLRELVKTAALEKSFSKQRILELYLNRIYLGGGAHGVDSAARTYFGVSAREVSLPQAAMLAALTRAPSVFSPRRDLGRAQARAALVLQAMAEMGAITPSQAREAAAQPATIIPRISDSHSYVLDAAAEEARRLTADSAAREVLVHTTIESGLQRQAENSVSAAAARFGGKMNFDQAALVVLKPDGAISAMVGGVDYRKSVFNRITQAHRQPGSAFKPFVYLAALEAGLSPWEMRDDRPVDIAGYQPANYKGAHYGRLSLADALARSVNTITVNLAQEIGIARVAAAAQRAGISSPLQNNASLALGTNEVTPLELASAYGFFATGGRSVTPFLVARVEDAQTGAALYERPDRDTPAIMADQVRKDLTAMLFQVVTAGTGTAARLNGREAAGKTGTSQDYRDAWFAGFTADHIAVAWVGNDDNRPMRKVTGGTIPALLWREVMTAAEAGTPPAPLVRTPGPPAIVEDPFGAMQVSYVDDIDASAPPLPVDEHGEVFAGSGPAARVARVEEPVPAYAQQPQPYPAQSYAPAYAPPAAEDPRYPQYQPEPQVQADYSSPPRPWREVRQLPYQAYRDQAENSRMRDGYDPPAYPPPSASDSRRAYYEQPYYGR